MDMPINIILILLACVFYYLAYESPRTDLFLYFMSGILFLVAGVSGLAVNDLSGWEVSENVVITINEVNASYSQVNLNATPIYSNSNFFVYFLPLLEILMAIYIFGIVATADKSKWTKNRELMMMLEDK